MPKQPAKIESLDDLIAQGEHYADFCMRGTGRITPALFLISPDGPLIFVPESLANETAKDDFATKARLVCIANGATACVMVLEAWATFAKPNEKLDLTEPPSEAFDRQEFVILMGEGPGVQRQKFLPIIRSDNGKFFGFGEPNDPGADNMTGRFAQILPPKAPDAAIREIARAMLKAQSVAPAIRRPTPRLPRSSR